MEPLNYRLKNKYHQFNKYNIAFLHFLQSYSIEINLSTLFIHNKFQ